MSALENKQFVKLDLRSGGSKWQWKITFGVWIFFVSHVMSQGLIWTDVISLPTSWRKPDGFHLMQKYEKDQSLGDHIRTPALSLLLTDADVKTSVSASLDWMRVSGEALYGRDAHPPTSPVTIVLTSAPRK